MPSSGPSSSSSSSSSGAVFAVVDIGRRDAVVGRREIWGPSSYAFLRDVDSATGMMTTMIGSGGATAATTGMNGAGDGRSAIVDIIDEWHDRVN